MLGEFSEFPQDPLTKEKIRKWLDDNGFVKKLTGYENPMILLGLVSDKNSFLEEVPAEERGEILWSHLVGVMEERCKCS